MDAFLRQQGAQLGQRDVAPAGDCVENELGVSLDLVRVPVAALRPGTSVPLLGVESAIPNSARRTDAKPLRSLAAGLALS